MAAEPIPMRRPRRTMRTSTERSPFLVEVLQVDDGWLTVCRQHGWLYATRREALAEASNIATGFDVGLLVHLGRRA